MDNLKIFEEWLWSSDPLKKQRYNAETDDYVIKIKDHGDFIILMQKLEEEGREWATNSGNKKPTRHSYVSLPDVNEPPMEVIIIKDNILQYSSEGWYYDYYKGKSPLLSVKQYFESRGYEWKEPKWDTEGF